jgi:hypothetical protein
MCFPSQGMSLVATLSSKGWKWFFSLGESPTKVDQRTSSKFYESQTKVQPMCLSKKKSSTSGHSHDIHSFTTELPMISVCNGTEQHDSESARPWLKLKELNQSKWIL